MKSSFSLRVSVQKGSITVAFTSLQDQPSFALFGDRRPMSKKSPEYIPALRYDWLTVLYDPLVRFTLRESTFKRNLVTQASIKDGQQVLDLGCGTATLTLLDPHKPVLALRFTDLMPMHTCLPSRRQSSLVPRKKSP